jgi:uncharacterized protein (DUF169 family)
MDVRLRDEFIRLWGKYFNDAELPIAFYYTDEPVQPASETRCIIPALARARKGGAVVLSAESVQCWGGRRYLGFAENAAEAFPGGASSGEASPGGGDYSFLEYFLSHGIPGKVDGERYKKTPKLFREISRRLPEFKAPARCCVFKRWDTLHEEDNPDVVIFFARPDVLSGLYTLANYDAVDLNEAIASWGSGCSSIIRYPFLEKESPHPRAVIGMFDVSARPFVAPDEISFSVPLQRFARMVESMEESFLITKSWGKVQKRI